MRNNKPAGIEAVFFDLYETLINEVRAERKPPESPGPLLGISAETFESEFRDRLHKRLTGVYRDYASVLRDICIATGQPIDEALIERLENERIELHSALFAAAEPAMLQLLEDIRDKGIRTGLISNASYEEISGFKDSPLYGLFDCVVYSCEAGHAKPSPEIYQIACERLNVKPEHCIYVGDGGSNELVGAAEVGMHPYQATWFMDRWPEDWRLQHELHYNTNYPKLRKPSELVELIESTCSPSSR